MKRRLVVSFAATVLVVAVASYRWPRVDPVTAPTDAVVILSSGIQSDTVLDPIGADRLDVGAQLAANIRAPLVVTMRVHHARNGLTSDSAHVRAMRKYGIANRLRIVDPAPPLNTYGEAIAARRALHVQRIVVVTSPPHTRRACAIFEKVGFTVTCYATHPLWTRPRLYFVGYEFAATIKAWWHGWL